MKRLNQSFGIGVIELKANPYESKVLFASRFKDLDFKTIDKLCKINADFEKFIEQTEKLMTASEKYISGVEKELDEFCDDYFTNDSESEKFVLPQLMVQPLLENAVKHGLYGVLGNVLISVAFEIEDQYLKISISNPYDPEAGQAAGEGFGLKAVKRRLFLLFGRHDLLQVKESKNLFVVELKIPQNYDQYSSH